MPVTTYNCDSLTGGSGRALDALKRADLADGDRAVVHTGGQTMRFLYVAAATDAEDTSTHPYKVRPDDFSSSGVWIEQTPANSELLQNHGPAELIAGRKNHIINGDFLIWQRGDDFTGLASAKYTADRWQYVAGNLSAAMRVYRFADVPDGGSGSYRSLYSCKLEVKTADATVDNSYAFFRQMIEGYNFVSLRHNPCVLSFWVKSSKTGTYCLSLRNSGHDLSFVTEYTIDQANTWEHKEIPITFDNFNGTWNYTNGVGLRVEFQLAVGSDHQTTYKDQWRSENKLATSSQVNFLDTVGNTFQLSQVQLEPGEHPTRFDYRPYQEELALCQRYFIKFNFNPTCSYRGVGAGSGGNESAVNFSFPQEMRAIPNADKLQDWKYYDGSNWVVKSTTLYVSKNDFIIGVAGNDNNAHLVFPQTKYAFFDAEI